MKKTILGLAGCVVFSAALVSCGGTKMTDAEIEAKAKEQFDATLPNA